MLYYAVLTVFSAVLVFDLRRQAKLRNDCCGLCCCSEKSIFFCRGYFLSPAMTKFSEQKGNAVCCADNTTPTAIENAKEGWCCCCCCDGTPPKVKNSDEPDKAEYIKFCFCFTVKKRRVDTESDGEIEL
jgi:hypothetical protein